MRIAVIEALEIHPSERIRRRNAFRHRAPSVGQEARPARPLLLTLLRDLAVAVVTSAACWAVVS